MREEELIKEYENLVYSISRRHHSKSVEENTGATLEDIIQEGMYGLVKAIRAYQEDEGKLSSYAYMYIRGYILKFLYRNSYKVKAPRRVVLALWKIRKEGLLDEKVSLIASTLGMEIGTVEDALSLHFSNPTSINALIEDGEGDATELQETIPAPMPDASESLLREFTESLPPKLSSVWKHYVEGGNQRDIAKLLGYSQTEIGRCLKKIFNLAGIYGEEVRRNAS